MAPRGRPSIVAFIVLAAIALARPDGTLAQQSEPQAAAPAQPQPSPTEPQSGTSQTQSEQPQQTPPQQPQQSPQNAQAPGVAQTVSQQADAWKLDLDAAILSLKRENVTDEELAARRAGAEKIIEAAHALEQQIQPELNAIQSRLNQLGPAPAEGDPAESPDITERRKAETAALAAADAALKKVRLAVVQAEQVVRDVSALRRDRFAQSLSVRNYSILYPALWLNGVQDSPSVIRGFRLLIGDSWAVATTRATVRSAATLAAAVVAAVVIGVFVRRFMRRLAPPIGDSGQDVPRLKKLLRAVMVMISDGVLPVMAVAVIYLALDITNLLTPRLIELNRGVFASIAVFSFLFGLSRGICAPLRPGWRLINMSDTAAAQTVASVTLIAAVLAVGIYLETANYVLVAPVSVEVVKRAATALLVAAILASGLWRLTAAPRSGGAPSQASIIWPWLRSIVWLAIGAIFVALVAGYIALANFIATQLVFAGAIFAIVWLLLGLIDEAVSAILVPPSRIGPALSSAFGISENGIMQLSLVASGVLRLIVIAFGTVLVALPWGFDTSQWNIWIRKAFFGFTIGEVTISLSSILGALILFGIGLVATRAIQGWLTNRFLPNTHLDLGLRNSIRTIVGYAGVVVAAIFAVTYLGLNLENVAILAGALSVGIGFGLQSIVNNFVSGLILLAERPIKEGDWIVVGAEQGNVRKISIRSTEIETFDRATVIVPNSDLITGTVKNWMHSNMMGRIVIPVGVSYGADPEQVRGILLDIARAHPDVLAYPEPRVYFMDFADSALTFNLYAFLNDVNNSLNVKSDFRFEILKRFREAGIEIPFPQRDINLRDIDRLDDAMAGRLRPTEKPAE